MNLLKKFGILALSGVMAAGFAACDKDSNDDNGGDNPPVIGPTKPDPTVTGVLSNEEAGQYFESTAKELDKICNPQDQAATVSALMAIADVLDSYEFADPVRDSAPMKKGLTEASRRMARAARSGNYAGMARAAQDVSQTLKVNPYEYRGIYTPEYDKQAGEYVWTRMADSKNSIVFRSEKDKMEVSLELSNDSWTGKFYTTDWEDDYDPSTGSWDEYEVVTDWTLTVPSKMTLKMVYSGQTATTAVVESNYNEKGHSFRVNANAEFANIRANVLTTGTDSKITAQCEAYVGTTRLMYSTAEVTGSGLCDRARIEALAQMSEDQIAAELNNMIKGATFSADLLDRIQLKGNVSSVKDIIATGDYDDERKSEVEAFAEAINNNVTARFFFGNTDYVQGSLICGVEREDDYGYTWYEPVPMIKLASGGSPMSIDDYFESGMFDSAADVVRGIIDSYRRAFNLN